MDHNCVRGCCGYRSWGGVGFVAVVDGVVVGFVGRIADCSGGRMADLSCCFGDSQIVGVVVDSRIVVAVDWGMIGD